MEQLPGADSIFLAMETPSAPGHVGGLTVLDPTDAPDFSFERLRDVIDERIRLAPRYTQKLQEVALGLDRPYLVADPDFDIANHVRRIAAPSPGGMRELSDLVSYLFARPLDRRRPLWEIWYIEGAENGRVALFMKSHHCLMDGQSGAGLGELMCDLSPNPEGGPILPPRNAAQERQLGDLEVALRATRNLVTTPVRIAEFSGRLMRQGVAMLRSLGDREAPPLPHEVPQTSFNREIGPDRGFACASVPLADIKAVKKHFDVTVNDVVLAITGAAVRSYLAERGELPDRSLAALIAVSKRQEGDAELGNQITSVPVGWATDIEDPVERLHRIHRNAEKSKELANDYDADFLSGMGDAFPPLLMNLFMRSELPLAGRVGNVVVSNVRGTPVPLYCAGARIECMYPMSILAPGQGLNITVVSYMDRMDVGFTVDPGLVEDPWRMAEFIPQALEELQAAMRAQVDAESRAAAA